MQNRRIRITCESSGLMTLDELENFQGKLKSIDADSFEKLKMSIEKYGFSFPIFVWGGNILDGHQRLAAVKSLIAEGWELDGGRLPVDPIEAVDRQEAAEKLLLINSRYATIDQSGFDLFVENFEIDIVEMGGLIEIPEIDFSAPDESFEGNTDPDDIPEVEETPVTQMGDVWILGEHRLKCGDSTKVEDVEALMDGVKADMVFTDPPYKLTGGGVTTEFLHGNLARDKFVNKSKTNLFEVPEFNDWMMHLNSTLKNNSELFIMSNNRNLLELMSILKELNAKLHNILVMKKDTYPYHKWYSPIHEFILYFYFGKAIAPLRPMMPSVFEVKIDKKDDKIHPTQKPVELLTSIFKNHPHQLIYEPFSGSGTTIIAAQQTGRKCYAMEISPQYVQVAVKRWQDFTGEKAVLESTGETFDEMTQQSEIM